MKAVSVIVSILLLCRTLCRNRLLLCDDFFHNNKCSQGFEVVQTRVNPHFTKPCQHPHQQSATSHSGTLRKLSNYM